MCSSDLLLPALTAGGRRDITRAEVEGLTSLGRTSSYVELNRLVEAGVLEVLGGSTRTTYRLRSQLRPTSGSGRRGPRPRWSEDRIRSELTGFAAELGRMPRRADFEATGRTGLYIAASKAGGLRRWAAELGF